MPDNSSGARYFDPAERARQKQASREADRRALANGKVSKNELSKANGFLDARDGAVPRWDLASKAM